MTSGKNVTTSQPSPGDVMDMWDGILKEGYEQVVYIPMSSALSASCHAAIQLSEEYDGKVQVVDDHRISVTMRESVLEAKWMANQGMTAEEIKKKLEENAYNSSIYIAVDTLEYLKKGGRVTAAGAAIGAVLNIKPVLTIQGEKLDAFTKVRGMKKAELKMLEAIEEDLNTIFQIINIPSHLTLIVFQKRIPFCSPIYSRCCRWIICYHFMLLFKIKCNTKSLCDVALINRVKPIIIAIIRIFLYTFKFRFILFKTCIFYLRTFVLSIWINNKFWNFICKIMI
jgi:hypothetical protein